MIAVDTNILVYSRREELPQHQAALARLTELAEGSEAWAIPVFCLGEFLRVVTHYRLFDPPSQVGDAVAFLSAILESPTARVLRPGPGYWSILTELIQQHGITGNLVYDAQIAAVCLEQGARDVLTNDRDFTRFADLRVLTL